LAEGILGAFQGRSSYFTSDPEEKDLGTEYSNTKNSYGTILLEKHYLLQAEGKIIVIFPAFSLYPSLSLSIYHPRSRGRGSGIRAIRRNQEET
jgi:hypothetical protein